MPLPPRQTSSDQGHCQGETKLGSESVESQPGTRCIEAELVNPHKSCNSMTMLSGCRRQGADITVSESVKLTSRILQASQLTKVACAKEELHAHQGQHNPCGGCVLLSECQ